MNEWLNERTWAQTGPRVRRAADEAAGRWLRALIIRQLIYSDTMIHSLCKYNRRTGEEETQ